jgi:ATP-dependent Lhr-like helicase
MQAPGLAQFFVVQGGTEQLDGYELAAAAWESDVLPARVRDYGGEQVDALCLSGRVAWGRLSPMGTLGKAPLRSSPIALMRREHATLWRVAMDVESAALTSEGRAVHDALAGRGASFFHELTAATRLLPTQVERALGELAGAGLVTADSFSGLRALLTSPEKRERLGRRRRTGAQGVDTAGRWALLRGAEEGADRLEAVARVLLKRYGVVFRSLLARESRLPPWRELAMVYRRLEARGEIRGGRFVSGFGGEQFALPEAVSLMRAVRKRGELQPVSVSAADPLNFRGILTPDERVPAVAKKRVQVG